MTSRWLTSEFWLCRSHMQSVRLPARIDKCWFANCKTHRPDEAFRPEPVEEPEPVVAPVSYMRSTVQRCSWRGCTEQVRENSKYCSRRCSNRNARSRHRKRKNETIAA